MRTPGKNKAFGFDAVYIRAVDGKWDIGKVLPEVLGDEGIWLDSNSMPSSTVAQSVSASRPHSGRYSIFADITGPQSAKVRYWHRGEGGTAHNGGEVAVDSATGCTRFRVSGFFEWFSQVYHPQRPGQVPRLLGPAAGQYDGDFALGWIGYLGYELYAETLGLELNGRRETPEVVLFFVDRAVVVDHVQERVFLLTSHSTDEWADRVLQILLRQSNEQSPDQLIKGEGTSGEYSSEQAGRCFSGSLPSQFSARSLKSRSEYLEDIRRIQREIAEGNTYEACLTTQVSIEGPSPLSDESESGGSLSALSRKPFSSGDRTAVNRQNFELYSRMRHRNPTAFSAYFFSNEISVLSNSPERFLALDSTGRLVAEPIKGTVTRSFDPLEDRSLKQRLANSPKDRAENIMIVDLLRNDLSTVAEPESLTVERLCDIESYATVHQLVSTISARLREGVHPLEAVRAAFPGGSMTGAPKHRTVDLLASIEGMPRGVYSGVLGYFSLSGTFDLSIVIRSLISENVEGGRRFRLGVGGAITADSDPVAEYREIQWKAQAALDVLQVDFPENSSS